jgi:bla regulator protein BlaR1
MESLVDIGLRNAILSVPLAVLALILGVTVRRPALLHLLWVLVLLRLVMPPLWNVAVPWKPMSAPVAAVDVENIPFVPHDSPAASTASATVQWLPGWSIFDDEPIRQIESEPPPAADSLPTASGPEAAPQVSELPATVKFAAPTWWPTWRMAIAWVWIGGTISLLLISALSILRFGLLLRVARNAPKSVQAQADEIASRLGLGCSPRLVMVNGRLSPMLWGFVGGPLLILPESLWRRLNANQRSALLAHEMAHYKRGDHWVRGLELLAVALFWWHPVVWLARHFLREAEEQCCDAWVVWALPAQRRDYATALVDTVGFLSEGRSVLPAMASGVGQVRHLRRRLTMIMRGTTPRRLPRLALAGLLTGGLAFVTLGTTWGDDRPGEPPTERRPEAGRGERDRPADIDPRIREELEKARKDFEDARKRLEELERRLSGRGAGRADTRPAEPRREPPREAGRGEGGPRTDDAPRFGPVPPPGAPGGPGIPGTPGVPRGFGGGPGGSPPIERRMQEMEKQMQEMARQLEEIRRMLQRGQGGDRGRSPGGAGGEGGSRPGGGRGGEGGGRGGEGGRPGGPGGEGGGPPAGRPGFGDGPPARP